MWIIAQHIHSDSGSFAALYLDSIISRFYDQTRYSYDPLRISCTGAVLGIIPDLSIVTQLAPKANYTLHSSVIKACTANSVSQIITGKECYSRCIHYAEPISYVAKGHI